MTEELIRTSVDDLLDLLKHTSKIPLADAAKKLGVPIDVVQAWIDFLVEESIVGIEYTFTTPYIYLNKPIETKKTKEQEKEENVTLDFFRKQFWEKAKANNMPQEKIGALWKNHLLQALELKRTYFFIEAQRKKLNRTEELWQEYENSLLST